MCRIGTQYINIDILSFIIFNILYHFQHFVLINRQGWKTQAVLASSSVPHILSLFSRSVRIWPQDKILWHQYVDFCLRAGSTKSALRVLLEVGLPFCCFCYFQFLGARSSSS